MGIRNGERHLGELLESLARQTEPPCELVVYDDASTDATPALVADFERHAPFPVRVESHTVRRGAAEASLRAVELCRGEGVAMCDGDDVWADDKLAVCARELEHSGATMVLHQTRVVDEQLRDLGRNYPVLGPARLIPPLGLSGFEVLAPGPAMVFRRSVFEAADRGSRPTSRDHPGKPMLHDEWVLFLAGVCGPIKVLDAPLIRYRQHSSNDSGGWVEPPSRLKLGPIIENYRDAARLSAEYAAFLDQVASRGGPFADRIAAGANHYRRAAENWNVRISLYDAADRRRRARLLRRLVAANAYGPRTAGGFGRAALGKDLAAGVALRVRAR